ncbi:hypothetical protein [Pinibacter aurantiacus]|uniref:BACON domain-containing protein n=1 Tax=Pinibacter aurantiacus TaxID=2851599 RepID=A0A9E2SBX4_9BACT|nr:hypothetical protein [Pinibacter aurantiacus]MBV4360248.1 hypothetical protein [Pinibacter aurantiacus]
MMQRKLLVAVLLVSILIFSCTKKDNGIEFELKSNVTELNLAANGGRDSLVINSTGSWKLSIPDNKWFSLSSVAVNSNDVLYVADYNANSICKVVYR